MSCEKHREAGRKAAAKRAANKAAAASGICPTCGHRRGVTTPPPRPARRPRGPVYLHGLPGPNPPRNAAGGFKIVGLHSLAKQYSSAPTFDFVTGRFVPLPPQYASTGERYEAMKALRGKWFAEGQPKPTGLRRIRAALAAVDRLANLADYPRAKRPRKKPAVARRRKVAA